VIARSLPVAVMLPSLEDENNLAQRHTASAIRVIIHIKCTKPWFSMRNAQFSSCISRYNFFAAFVQLRCSAANYNLITRSSAVAKRPCDCCVSQFRPNITERRQFTDIISPSLTTDGSANKVLRSVRRAYCRGCVNK